MNSITVKTPKELKSAIEAKYDQIIITGSLAKQVKKAEKIKKLSPAILASIGGLGALAIAAVAAAPAAAVIIPGVGAAAPIAAFAAAAAPVAVASGISIPVLLIIAFVGLSAMSVLFDDYTHAEFINGRIIFERKRKSSN